MMHDFYRRYYKQLEGATITKFQGMVDEDGLDPFPKFYAKAKDGTKLTLEISRDEEGNGGGFIFGLPIPEEK